MEYLRQTSRYFLTKLSQWCRPKKRTTGWRHRETPGLVYSIPQQYRGNNEGR